MTRRKRFLNPGESRLVGPGKRIIRLFSFTGKYIIQVELLTANGWKPVKP